MVCIVVARSICATVRLGRRAWATRALRAEETVRIAISEVVGAYGEAKVERHSYDWRADDLLVWVRAPKALAGITRSLFRHRVAATMRGRCPAGQTFEEWIVAALAAEKSRSARSHGL